jgi:hypothetical protein
VFAEVVGFEGFEGWVTIEDVVCLGAISEMVEGCCDRGYLLNC